MPEPVELTPEDIRNGWTLEKLQAYHAERMKQSMAVVMFDPKARPAVKPMAQSSRYLKFRWRG